MTTELLNALLTKQLPKKVQGTRLPRMDAGPFPTDLELDDNGYPAAHIADEIRMVAARRAREWLHDVFPVLFEQFTCSSVVTEETTDIVDKPALSIRVATGGWSGCEEIMHAVLDHFVMRYYLKSTHAGGAYTFIVPHDGDV